MKHVFQDTLQIEECTVLYWKHSIRARASSRWELEYVRCSSGEKR